MATEAGILIDLEISLTYRVSDITSVQPEPILKDLNLLWIPKILNWIWIREQRSVCHHENNLDSSVDLFASDPIWTERSRLELAIRRRMKEPLKPFQKPNYLRDIEKTIGGDKEWKRKWERKSYVRVTGAPVLALVSFPHTHYAPLLLSKTVVLSYLWERSTEAGSSCHRQDSKALWWVDQFLPYTG